MRYRQQSNSALGAWRLMMFPRKWRHFWRSWGDPGYRTFYNHEPGSFIDDLLLRLYE